MRLLGVGPGIWNLEDWNEGQGKGVAYLQLQIIHLLHHHHHKTPTRVKDITSHQPKTYPRTLHLRHKQTPFLGKRYYPHRQYHHSINQNPCSHEHPHCHYHHSHCHYYHPTNQNTYSHERWYQPPTQTSYAILMYGFRDNTITTLHSPHTHLPPDVAGTPSIEALGDIATISTTAKRNHYHLAILNRHNHEHNSFGITIIIILIRYMHPQDSFHFFPHSNRSGISPHWLCRFLFYSHPV